MEEEIDFILDSLKESMQKSMEHLDKELTKIRAGKANPSMVGSVMVDYYGSMTPITQVANIGSLDGRTLTVQPWEKGILGEVNRGIINSNLGLTPQDNGEMLIINVPPLTEERRKQMTKYAKAEGEHAKVAIRNHRKDAMDYIKELKNEGLSEDDTKRAEDEIQQLTNEFVERVDKHIEAKEKDIMTV